MVVSLLIFAVRVKVEGGRMLLAGGDRGSWPEEEALWYWERSVDVHQEDGSSCLDFSFVQSLQL